MPINNDNNNNKRFKSNLGLICSALQKVFTARQCHLDKAVHALHVVLAAKTKTDKISSQTNEDKD